MNKEKRIERYKRLRGQGMEAWAAWVGSLHTPTSASLEPVEIKNNRYGSWVKDEYDDPNNLWGV